MDNMWHDNMISQESYDLCINLKQYELTAFLKFQIITAGHKQD